MPQMTSFHAGQQRVRRLLAVVDRRRRFASFSEHSLAASLANFGGALGRERGRGDDEHRDGDAGDCDERTDASTHRSSCPGLSPR